VIVDLADAMRCPALHAPTALITAVDRLAGRSVITGTLGCPVCNARYPVIDGAGVFDPVWHARLRAESAMPLAQDTDVIRVAALLDLTDSNGVVLLEGVTAAVGASLHTLIGTALVLLNPPGPISAGGDLSVIYGPVAPFAPGSLRGAAFSATPGAGVVASVIAAVRPGGRVMAPLALAVPPGVAALARDAHGWVGARQAEASTTPVSLTRGPRQASA
jgi:uncharacterized protein YbaR (Trm112 family)